MTITSDWSLYRYDVPYSLQKFQLGSPQHIDHQLQLRGFSLLHQAPNVLAIAENCTSALDSHIRRKYEYLHALYMATMVHPYISTKSHMLHSCLNIKDLGTSYWVYLDNTRTRLDTRVPKYGPYGVPQANLS